MSSEGTILIDIFNRAESDIWAELLNFTLDLGSQIFIGANHHNCFLKYFDAIKSDKGYYESFARTGGSSEDCYKKILSKDS